MRIAITTIIANAMATGAVMKPSAVGSAASGASDARRAATTILNIEFRPYRINGLLLIHAITGQPQDHFLCGFGRNGFNLRKCAVERITNLRLGLLQLCV